MLGSSDHSCRHDAEPKAALEALVHHDGPLLLDLDETAYLRNSTEDFLDTASPGLPALLLLRLLDAIRPWRWTGGEATRDLWRVRLVPEHLSQSYRIIVGTIDILENDTAYCNTMPKCEPQLGRRGLYGAIEGGKDAAAANLAMLWILNFSDGMHSLLDIAQRADLPFGVIRSTAEQLKQYGLLNNL